jgi:hypothetical protein
MIYAAVSSLVWVGFYYGYRFLRMKNNMLGYEWFFLALSASNIILDKAGVFEVSVHIWHYLDTFSKLFGIPVIGAIGLMKVTHNFELSKVNQVLVFAVALGLSYGFETWDAMSPILPGASILAAVFFLLFCGYIAQQAFKYKLNKHGWLMILLIAINICVAAIQDFIPLPNEDTAIFFNKFVIETLAWSLLFGEIFYVYQDLAHKKNTAWSCADESLRQLNRR